ncbi:DUF982 domain-containing protein [Mesorhizobium sp. SP-1A]|uniref:DUF982 domain-containing protein n=1 Tax=Mesorhizobium sp. SP-1A TaxID=3077840 RepID=UPI0028F6DA63|nr:DUF982 domain-containing protein [Mesorhizobium sp. SP-1A]
MNDVRFPEPVTLKFLTASRNVASSFEALECLDQQWPEWARGRSWRAAGRACRDAHKAFLNAARRAGLIPSEARAPRKSRSVRVIDSLRPEVGFSGWL